MTAMSEAPLIDHDTLQRLGVLVPLRFQPLRVLPGRHSLGQSGEGMRLLRTRPYVPGEDNPRDIDKFSPAAHRQVIEWEAEAQAAVTILADSSASMHSPLLAPLRNLSVLQLSYSLARAGDRVSLALFDTTLRHEVRSANLAQQLQQTTAALSAGPGRPATDIHATLAEFSRRRSRSSCNLLFLVSDFAGESADTISRWRRLLAGLACTLVPVIVSCILPITVRGAMKLVDAETQKKRLVGLHPRGISSINRDESERVESIVRQFYSLGLDSLVIRRQRDVYPAIVQLASARRSRRS